MTKLNKRFIISQRKEVVVNNFKGISYVHLFDKVNGKSISFTSSEYQRFNDKHGDICNAFKSLKPREEKHKMGQKKRKSTNDDESRKRKTNCESDDDLSPNRSVKDDYDDYEDDDDDDDNYDERRVKKDVRKRKKIIRVKRCQNSNAVDVGEDDSCESAD